MDLTLFLALQVEKRLEDPYNFTFHIKQKGSSHPFLPKTQLQPEGHEMIQELGGGKAAPGSQNRAAGHGPIARLASKKGSSQNTMRLLWSHHFLCFKGSSPCSSLPSKICFPLNFSLRICFVKPLIFLQETDHVPCVLINTTSFVIFTWHGRQVLSVCLSHQIMSSTKAGITAYSFFHFHISFFAQYLALTRVYSLFYIYCIFIETIKSSAKSFSFFQYQGKSFLDYLKIVCPHS